jgi:aldehyde:ferredoxin oxidoreductase
MVGLCKFAGLPAAALADAVAELTGLDVTADSLREMTVKTFLRGYRLEKLQGMTIQDYSLPQDALNNYPNVDLPDFVTPEFFAELQTKVTDIFDQMLNDTDIGTLPA